MKIRNLIFASVLSFMAFSCGQLSDKAGKAMCACTQEMFNMESEEESNPGTYTAEQFKEAEENMLSCMDKAKKQYKDVVSKDEVKKGIKDNCPDTYKKIMAFSFGQLSDKAGKAMCACTQEMFDMESEEESNPGTYTAEQFNEAEENMLSCMDKAKKQYKDVVSKDEVKKGIKDNCPDTYKKMFPND